MGIDVLHINLNTPPHHIYRSGDIVAGSVKLITSPDADLSAGLTISLYGHATVEWNERSGNHSITYSGSEQIFENTLTHSCTHDQTSYPFSVQIPSTPALPWPTVTLHGRVEYGVKAVIQRPWYKLGNKEATEILTLNSHLNSRIAATSKNYEYYSKAITSKDDETNAGFCCVPFCCWYLLSREKIKLTLSTESLWTYPGEDLPFTLEVDNRRTGRQLGNAKVQLVGTWLHQGRCWTLIGDGITKDKTTETVVHEEIVQMSVSPGDQVTKKGLFKIPMDVMPTQVECSILKLKYKLKGVMDEISGYTCIKVPATVEVDVLIGTLGADESLTVM